MKIKAFAAQSPTSLLAEHTIERRLPGNKDVQIDILYCGVCHSDIHTARGEWPGVRFPSVPGHEIIGRVVAVGTEVEKYKKDDIVEGVVIKFNKHGALASIEEGVAGLVHISEFASEDDLRAKLELGKVYPFTITFFEFDLIPNF